MDKDFIYQPKTVRPIFLSLVLGSASIFFLVLGNQFNIFQTIRQFLASLTVSSHYLLSTFVMGLFSGLSAWFGNSQSFALNSLVDDNFALENLTYAVTHHTTTGIPSSLYLDQFVPQFWSGGWCRRCPSAFGCNLIGFTEVKRTRKSVSSVCFQVSLTTGRLSW